MGHSYKGQSANPGSLTLWAAWTTANTGTGAIGWAYPANAPPRAYVYQAPTSGGAYVFFANVPTVNAGISGLTSGWYAIVQGCAVDGSPITKLSTPRLVT